MAYQHDPAPRQAPGTRETHAPACCGRPMREITRQADRRLGLRTYLCELGCGREQQQAAGQPDPPAAAEPTGAAPGSAEKIEVMRRRVAAGLAATRPGDNGTVPRPTAAVTRPARAAREPGVYKARNKWRARVCVPGSRGKRRTDLGLFGTYEEAAAAARAYRAGLAEGAEGAEGAADLPAESAAG